MKGLKELGLTKYRYKLLLATRQFCSQVWFGPDCEPVIYIPVDEDIEEVIETEEQAEHLYKLWKKEGIIQ